MGCAPFCKLDHSLAVNIFSLADKKWVHTFSTEILWQSQKTPYFIEYSVHFFYIENDAGIFPAHYTSKVAEIGFKMNKLAMINSCEIIPIFFCQKPLWNSGAHYICMHIILNKIWCFLD